MEENIQQKGYGGCLSAMLVLGIGYQILLIIYNALIATDEFTPAAIPVTFIILNVIEIIALVLMMKFNKIGFYLYVFVAIAIITIDIAFPDQVFNDSLARNIFAFIFFIGIMFTKNKETGLNAYQTLGLYGSKIHNEIDKKENAEDDNHDPVTPESIIPESEKDEDLDNSPILDSAGSDTLISEVKDDSLNEEVTSENDNSAILNAVSEENAEERPLLEKTTNIFSLLKINKIWILTSVSVLVMSAIVISLFAFHKTDEEKFEQATELLNTDKNSAIEILEELCNNGYCPALTKYGKMLLKGDNVQMNVSKAKMFLIHACMKEDTTAQDILGNYYFESEGKIDSAIYYLEQSINLGCKQAAADLSYLYVADQCMGAPNKLKNYDKAIFYAEKVADSNSLACFVLGNVYSDKENYEKAFYWWSRGAKMDNTSCLANLGWAYLNAKGVSENYQKAFECFEKTLKIDSQDSYAHYMLGVMYQNGFYVCQDIDSARSHYQISADLGYEDAQEELINLTNE